MSEDKTSDETAVLASIAAHRDYVRAQLSHIAHLLDERGRLHDLSKLREDELAGFSRINRAAREHPYGSPEYRDGLKREKPTIELHYSRNSHHPEHHELPHWTEAHYFKAEHMPLLDVIEMVCDWRGAYLGYGSQGTWGENIARQRERYADWFTAGQWWVIVEVASLLAQLGESPEEPTP